MDSLHPSRPLSEEQVLEFLLKKDQFATDRFMVHPSVKSPILECFAAYEWVMRNPNLTQAAMKKFWEYYMTYYGPSQFATYLRIHGIAVPPMWILQLQRKDPTVDTTHLLVRDLQFSEAQHTNAGIIKFCDDVENDRFINDSYICQDYNLKRALHKSFFTGKVPT